MNQRPAAVAAKCTDQHICVKVFSHRNRMQRRRKYKNSRARSRSPNTLYLCLSVCHHGAATKSVIVRTKSKRSRQRRRRRRSRSIAVVVERIQFFCSRVWFVAEFLFAICFATDEIALLISTFFVVCLAALVRFPCDLRWSERHTLRRIQQQLHLKGTKRVGDSENMSCRATFPIHKRIARAPHRQYAHKKERNTKFISVAFPRQSQAKFV